MTAVAHDLAAERVRRSPADLIALPRLASIKARGGWMARCPAHEDRERSLSLRLGDDGRLLVHCFAGCRTTEIVAAVGLGLRDLFPVAAPRSRPARRISAKRTLLDQARAEILREGRRQQARLAPYRVLFMLADSVRVGFQLAARARLVATQIGDTEVAWKLLRDAATVESDARDTEAELDQCLAEKRLPT